MSLLEISKPSKRLIGLKAFECLDLNVYQEEILGLIGHNGAVKSTVLNMINGSICPTSGKLIFQGHNIAKLPPHQRARSR